MARGRRMLARCSLVQSRSSGSSCLYSFCSTRLLGTLSEDTMKTSKSRFTSDEGLVLVNPLPDVGSFDDAGKIPNGIPDTIQTADDMVEYFRNKLIPYQYVKKPAMEQVMSFFDDLVRDLKSFIDSRGYSPENVPVMEHIYELYNREKFPPKSHQRIMQAIADKTFGIKVEPKRVNGAVKMSYTGTYFESSVLDIFGRVLLPRFDSILQTGFRALYESTPESRARVRAVIERNFIEKVVSIIQKHINE